MSWWFKTALWKRVLGGLILGVALGAILSQIMGDDAAAAWLETWVKPIGDLFFRLIMMLIVPLIFTTLVSGVVGLGDPKRLGTIGGKTLGLFLITSFFAVWIGIIFALVLQPGMGVSLGGADAVPVSTEAPTLTERLLAIVPTNPVAALANTDFLAIIFFSVLLGIGILMAGKEGKLIGDIFSASADVVLKITHMVMEVAPFGVFALVAHTIAAQGIEALAAIAVLIVTVYLALIFHLVFIYGAFTKFVLGLSPIKLMRGMMDALAVAFSTASSSATLPVTIANATDNLGVKRSVAGSVLPLGATINMDGTGIYLGILAVFTAQAFGYDLGFADYALIAFTAAIASIGAAGIPSAGLFLMALVLSAFNVPPEQVAIIVGFILPVDRIMDMGRTMLNVSGDAAIATAIAKWEGELDIDRFNAPADKPYHPPSGEVKVENPPDKDPS